MHKVQFRFASKSSYYILDHSISNIVIVIVISRLLKRYLKQRRQSGLKSGGSWIRVQKISIFQGKFLNFFILQAISQKFRFFRQILAIYSNFWANYTISLQSHHFRTYSLYMIRYNNIFHDPSTT